MAAMKWYQETTTYDGAKAANHVYLLDDSKTKMYAYRAFGTGPVHRFESPKGISARGRTFVAMGAVYDLMHRVQAPTPPAQKWIVVGSGGNRYTVTEQAGQLACSCSGFRFRAQCRHVDHMRQTLAQAAQPAV
jgi:hypothetical protein